jgi:hypothetical protein
MSETPLARAARAHLGNPESDRLRRHLYEVLAGAELVLPLASDQGDAVAPRLLEIDGRPFVLAHDGPETFAAEGGGPAASLSGAALAAMLAGQGTGLALGRGAEPWLLLPPEALGWLAQSLAAGPERAEARPLAAYPPAGLPPALLAALDRRLAQAEGLARAALLARVEWSDGTEGHLLAVIGAQPGSEEALATGLHAAVALSGAEGLRLDVTFLDGADAVAERLGRVGLRFDLRAPPPAGPPRLR